MVLQTDTVDAETSNPGRKQLGRGRNRAENASYGSS
jgi:hypothetical protein